MCSWQPLNFLYQAILKLKCFPSPVIPRLLLLKNILNLLFDLVLQELREEHSMIFDPDLNLESLADAYYNVKGGKYAFRVKFYYFNPDNRIILLNELPGFYQFLKYS